MFLYEFVFKTFLVSVMIFLSREITKAILEPPQTTRDCKTLTRKKILLIFCEKFKLMSEEVRMVYIQAKQLDCIVEY
jgi:hypothetical protein